MNEAYPVGLEKVNFHAPIPDGFNPDVIYQLRENTIKDNLLRYAGEYRLGVKFDEYYYQEEYSPLTGERHLASSEPGPIRDIFRRAISSREDKGLSVRREVAECLGFEKLENAMLSAPVGTMAIWVSPPGEKEDGYGTYGFTFLAQVEASVKGRRVRMIPYRNELSILEHNKYLSEVTKTDVSFTKDIQFLANPIIFGPNDDVASPEDVLYHIGEKEKFDVKWKKAFDEKARPFIQAFLYLVKTNAPDAELIKIRNAYENFAIAYKEDPTLKVSEMIQNEELVINTLDIGNSNNLLVCWGRYEPPKVQGSCGSTGEVTEPDKNGPTLPMEFHEAEKNKKKGQDEDDKGKREFNCPSCNTRIRRPYNKLVERCPNKKCKKPESVAC